MNLAPIVLFVYNRPWHTQQSVEALLENELSDQSDLIIFSDGPKNDPDRQSVKAVREYIKTIDGFKSIIIKEQKINKGLANSIIDGVTSVIKIHRRIIVLEDDLLTAPYYLRYMNEALDFYLNEKRIFAISGYGFPINIPQNYNKTVYIDYRSSSWGWGSWSDRWTKIDWNVTDFKSFKKNKASQKLFNRSGRNLTEMLFMQMKGKIDSWAIRRTYAQFKQKAYTVFPTKSLIINIGFDGSGVHCGTKNISSKLAADFFPELEHELEINVDINRQIRAINSTRYSLLYKIYHLIKRRLVAK